MLLFKVGAVYLSITIMIFIPYTCLYLQHTDIYTAKIRKRNETGKLSRDYFLTYYHFSGKWCEESLTNDANSPIPLYSHINIFFLKKVSKYHYLQIYHWYIMNYKMILPNIFTKKYHRSIMNSIEVSLNHHDAS